MSTVVNPEPNPFAKRRVLVVEDDLDSVHSMAVLLKVMGHEVEYAINGFAALDIARRFRPEFVLLDVSLPHLSGDKLARQLKYEPGLEKTRMIAITGLPLDQVERLVLEAGCEAVYAKPIAPAVLEELLAKP
jgi:CheY-like chemotaxis protein